MSESFPDCARIMECELVYTPTCASCPDNEKRQKLNDQTLKADAGKTRWELVKFKALKGIAEVLGFGAEKYSAESWQQVDPTRYKGALLRHIFAYLDGEELDQESGLHHLDHAQTNLMFLRWFSLQRKK